MVLYLALANTVPRQLALPRPHVPTPIVACFPAFAREKFGGVFRLSEFPRPSSGHALHFGLSADRSDDCGDVRVR